MDDGQYRELLLWVIYLAIACRMLIAGLEPATIGVHVRRKSMKRADDNGQI